LAGAKIFSLRHRVQTGSAAHPTSYPVGTGGSSSGVKRREAEHSRHVVPRLRMRGAIPLLPHTSLWRCT